MKHTPHEFIEIPVSVIEKATLVFADFSLCSNGVIVIRLDDELCFDQENSIVFIEEIRKIGRGKPLKMLMIPGEQTTGDHFSRQYFALPEHINVISKSAIVLNSSSQRLVGNFFLRVNKPAIPTKLFNYPEEAWNWLIDGNT